MTLISSQRRLFTTVVLAGLAVAGTPALAEPAPGGTVRVYVGTYTGGGSGSKGVYVFEFDTATGKASPARLAAETVSPSFLAIDPTRRFLYAVGEVDTFQGQKGGGVSAFSVDGGTGRLGLLNAQSSGGAGPCHLVVDRAGKNVLVANYGGGSVAVLPVEADGRLKPRSAFVQHTGSSVNPGRQKEPHAHSVNLDAANRYAVVADLGLDRVLVYKFDPSRGTITPNDPPAAVLPPGSGPRHFAFHPGGKSAYAVNELNSTVTAWTYDPDRGVLTDLQTISTLPRGFRGVNYPAEVQVHPSGKFVYASNRGHDSIAVFGVDAGTGRLTYVENEAESIKTPRNFGIEPTGTFLLVASQDADAVAVFRVDPATGGLAPTGQSVKVPKPVCVKFWTPAA